MLTAKSAEEIYQDLTRITCKIPASLEEKGLIITQVLSISMHPVFLCIYAISTPLMIILSDCLCIWMCKPGLVQTFRSHWSLMQITIWFLILMSTLPLRCQHLPPAILTWWLFTKNQVVPFLSHWRFYQMDYTVLAG